MPLSSSSPAPRKPKRVPPPNLGYQFAVGRPGETVADSAWHALRSSSSTPLPPYQSHFDPIWNIRNVVQRLDAFVRAYRGNVEPFVLRVDALGKSSILARMEARAVAELFTTQFARILRTIGTEYPNHRFHPLFQIFLEVGNERAEDKGAFASSQLEIACNNYLSVYFQPTKLHQQAMVEVTRMLNEMSKKLLGKARSLSEEIKQFQRAAQDTRTSAMQYAHHLLMRAPNLFFVHLTLHRSPFAIGNGPVTYLEIRKMRDKFKRMLKKDIPDSNYLGYSILLRHNAKIGYWLDAFIYLSDSLGLAPSTVYEIAQKWNSDIGSKGVEINYVAWAAHPNDEKIIGHTLASMTIATEPDFYCHAIPPNGHHTFWCSQSPIGKLAKRTQYRKRSNANASKRKRESRNELAKDLTSEDTRRLFEQAFAAWDQAREKKAKKTAERRSKATETRQRKRKLGKPTP